MKILSGLKLCVGATLLGLASAAAPTPVSNVHVTLKGKKYQIDDVTTVSELQERLEEQSGIPPSKQGKILHNGKRLGGGGSVGDANGNESLSDAGVVEGDQLNCVPAKKSSGSKKKASSTAAAASSPAPAESSSGSGGGDSLADMMKGLEGALGGAGGGAGGLDDMMSKLMSGGMGGAGGGMPDMAESMKMMKELTNSPLFSEYMNDPEKLEESRQMILNNPMMKAMMASMPGMSEILEDKEAWAQAMMAAAGIMKSMDPEDMMKMMEAGAGGGMMPPGMGGMGGMGGSGLFDGAGASSALDELSEDDE
mmetsp:Transcript_15976/g.36861  ORF Transcript_15976/g.36861 Transcript_15976/m.36861 type:complete len:309 (+) Transcript_15976:73-999(+)